MSWKRFSGSGLWYRDMPNGFRWVQQNPRTGSLFARAARLGHKIAWEFSPKGDYTGRVYLDGKVLSREEARQKLLNRK